MTDMLTRSAPAVDASGFRPGLIIGPGDSEWDEARQAWNLAVDQHPVAIALPTTADEIAAVVRLAREQGLRVTGQGTGHNARPLGDLSDVVVIRTHLMRGVQIDAAAQVARAEAGALWLDVVGPAAEHGLVGLHGSAADVGVVGYHLGGGVSWYSRRYGLASSRVLAVELVTADGDQLRVTRDSHPDLFFAVRGGGGSFGIVTAIEFELIALSAIQAGGLWWSADRAAEVWKAWARWAPTLPETVTSTVRLLNVPDIPDAPPELRGRSFAIVLAAVLGDAQMADEVLAPMRALGPDMDTVVPTAPQDMIHLAMDPPNPVPHFSTDAILDEVTPEAVDAILGAVKDAPTVAITYLQQVGGAAARPQGTGARTHLDAQYLLFSAGMMAPGAEEMTLAAIGRLREAVVPHESRARYLNFAEHREDPARFFDPATYARLREIKAAVDPENRVLANHAILPSE